MKRDIRIPIRYSFDILNSACNVINNIIVFIVKLSLTIQNYSRTNNDFIKNI